MPIRCFADFLLERETDGHVDIPRLADGNVALQVFSVPTKSPHGLNIGSNDETGRNRGTPPAQPNARGSCRSRAWQDERRISLLISPSRYKAGRACPAPRRRVPGSGRRCRPRRPRSRRRAPRGPVHLHLQQLPVQCGRVLVHLARLGQLVEAGEPGLGAALARADAARGCCSLCARPRARSSGPSVRPWPISVAITTIAARWAVRRTAWSSASWAR